MSCFLLNVTDRKGVTEGDASGQRWHWLVYDGAESCFVRNRGVTGGQDEAERVARAAIALLGGIVEVARR